MSIVEGHLVNKCAIKGDLRTLVSSPSLIFLPSSPLLFLLSVFPSFFHSFFFPPPPSFSPLLSSFVLSFPEHVVNVCALPYIPEIISSYNPRSWEPVMD